MNTPAKPREAFLAEARGTLRKLLMLWATAVTLCLAQDVLSIMHGTIQKIDKTTKTFVVKTADGAEHTIRITDQAAIHGTKDGIDGLQEGSEVIVRSAETGTERTTDDVGKIGKDGMEVTEGTIENLDRATKTLIMKDLDGTERTFEYTARAEDDLGKVVVKGAERGARVTVYYTEEGGKKIAYFFASGHRISRPNPLATSAAGGKNKIFPPSRI